MSHFTVLVIGDDIEGQLQPYHEFECTGTDDQYVVDVDVTQETREKGLEEYGFEDRTVTNESQIDLADKHKYGYAIVRDGEVIKAVKRTNENAHWDWWMLGGRWTGFFKLKPGATGEVGEPGIMTSAAKSGRADQAYKRDIDFEAMRQEKALEAREYWQKANAITKGEKWHTWDEVRARFDTTKADEMEMARQAYWRQPVIKALRKEREFSFDIDENLRLPLEEYEQIARDTAVSTFAYVKDGEWHEKGNMGWWGIVSGAKDANTWVRGFNEMLDALPDDTLLSVVDCHI